MGLYHLQSATVVVPLWSIERCWDVILLRLDPRGSHFWSWRHSGFSKTRDNGLILLKALIVQFEFWASKISSHRMSPDSLTYDAV